MARDQSAARRLPLLVVALLALLPGRAVATPPEGLSGAMVLDEVADGLRRYRREKNPEKRAAWLQRLTEHRDVRAAVVMGEALSDPSPEVAVAAVQGLNWFWVPEVIYCNPLQEIRFADLIWKELGPDLRAAGTTEQFWERLAADPRFRENFQGQERDRVSK
jgi:hypothetical protein